MERVPVNEKNRPQQEIKLHKVSNVGIFFEVVQIQESAAGDDPRKPYRRRVNSMIRAVVREQWTLQSLSRLIV